MKAPDILTDFGYLINTMTTIYDSHEIIGQDQIGPTLLTLLILG